MADHKIETRTFAGKEWVVAQSLQRLLSVSGSPGIGDQVEILEEQGRKREAFEMRMEWQRQYTAQAVERGFVPTPSEDAAPPWVDTGADFVRKWGV